MEMALDEVGKVVKKQKTCASRTNDCMNRLLELATKARDTLAAEHQSDSGTLIANLKQQIEGLGLTKELNSQTRDLHSAIGKLNKALDRTLENQPDLCKALRDVPLDQSTLNQVIAEHFYREGKFEIADRFAAEAQIPESEQLKRPYIAMHTVLAQIKARNLEPALLWAGEHRMQLSNDGQPSAFEFNLHSVNFLHVLTQRGRSAALSYAKQHFPPFQQSHMREIQRLMGCLVYSKRSLHSSPYCDLVSCERWDDLARDFTKQACSLMGQATESPLAVVVAAGSVALPLLLKLAQVMETSLPEFKSCEQLPLELELGPEFVFHSIFACPVSKDESTPDNPPMLLPCNHVLCEQSILKIAKSRTRVFKCPYCPMEARADNLRPLVFPDVE